MRTSRLNIPDWCYHLAVAVMIGLSVARIAATYPTLTQTVDEPLHLACGTEWLLGVDNCGQEHPPLAKVAIALGPWLKGIRPSNRDGSLEEGNSILYAGGEYFRNLALARMGTLPFLMLACVVVYLWARRWFDAASGFWAVFLFVSLPPVLGNAGLATTDMASCATALAAVYLFVRWIEAPQLGRALVLAVGISAALLSKFSSVLFLPTCFAAVLLVAAVADRDTLRRIGSSRWVRQAIAAKAVVLLCLWAGYGFALAPILRGEGAHPWIEGYVGDSAFLRWVISVPLPLTAMVRGIHQIYVESLHPLPSFFLGRINDHGSWAFFPVLALVKTPIGFLALAACGVVLVSQRRATPWQQRATTAAAAAIAVVCVTAGINMGLRHALAIYPFLAIAAGHGVARALGSPHRRLQAGSLALVAWLAFDSWTAHADQFTYFNRLAGKHPENIVAGSDLDWGQDLHRLSQRLKVLGVQDISLAYFGTARIEEAGLPRFRELKPRDIPSGYAAISVHFSKQWYGVDGSFGWIRPLTPLERIGKSIDLYYVPPSIGQ